MLRVFRGSFLVAIDENESIEAELEEFLEENSEITPVNVNQLAEYLKNALILDIDQDEGDPHGFQSAELLYDTMQELTPEEISVLGYPKS